MQEIGVDIPRPWSLASRLVESVVRRVFAETGGMDDRVPENSAACRQVSFASSARSWATAVALGAAEMPPVVRHAMRLFAKVMTKVAYRF